MPFDVDLYRKVAYSALHFLMTFSIRGQRLDAFMYQCLGALQFTLFISLLTFIYIPSHLAPHQITCAGGILLIEMEKELSLGFQITCAIKLNATLLL